MGGGGAPEDRRGVTAGRRPSPVVVEVRLFANLAGYGPPGAREGAARVELPAGATLHDLLRRLRIPDELPRLLLLNGHDVEPTVRLSPGDVVSVLPPLVGG